MQKTGYNGWTNYETWNVSLWIDNEQGSYEMFQEVTRNAINAVCAQDKDGEDLPLTDDQRHDAILVVAASIESWVDENTPEISSGFIADILGAALSEINYYEIAENWVKDNES